MPVKQQPEEMLSGRSRGMEKARSSNTCDFSFLEVYSRYQKINWIETDVLIFSRRIVCLYGRDLSPTFSVPVVGCCTRPNWIHYVFFGLSKYWFRSFRTPCPKI